MSKTSDIKVFERILILTYRTLRCDYTKLHCDNTKLHCGYRKLRCNYRKLNCVYRKLHCDLGLTELKWTNHSRVKLLCVLLTCLHCGNTNLHSSNRKLACHYRKLHCGYKELHCDYRKLHSNWVIKSANARNFERENLSRYKKNIRRMWAKYRPHNKKLNIYGIIGWKSWQNWHKLLSPSQSALARVLIPPNYLHEHIAKCKVILNVMDGFVRYTHVRVNFENMADYHEREHWSVLA